MKGFALVVSLTFALTGGCSTLEKNRRMTCEASVDDIFEFTLKTNKKIVCGEMVANKRDTIVRMRRPNPKPVDDDALQVILDYPYPEAVDRLEEGKSVRMRIVGVLDVDLPCFDPAERQNQGIEACVPFSRPAKFKILSAKVLAP